jgi:hypothetical protein
MHCGFAMESNVGVRRTSPMVARYYRFLMAPEDLFDKVPPIERLQLGAQLLQGKRRRLIQEGSALLSS